MHENMSIRSHLLVYMKIFNIIFGGFEESRIIIVVKSDINEKAKDKREKWIYIQIVLEKRNLSFAIKRKDACKNSLLLLPNSPDAFWGLWSFNINHSRRPESP